MSLWQVVRFSLLTNRLGQALRASPARVARWQRERLDRLVRVAVARSPFFREKYRGIDLRRFELADLPPSNKEELMANFDQAVTDPAVGRKGVESFLADPSNLGRWFLGRYAVSHTSGSQGQPMLIVQDRRSLEILFAMMSARANAAIRPGLMEGIRRLRSPARLAIVTLRRGFYPSGAAFEFMPEIVGPYVRLRRLSSVQPDLVERLVEFQPTVLVAYASVLEALALRADRPQFPQLRQISNSSEQLTDRARRRIEDAFGVPVLDHYGIGECLLLSDGCPTGGAHVNADWAILEVVDERYRPVAPGQLGRKVLITNLANSVQPIIRYEVSDRVLMAAAPCRCGNRLPRIDRIEGRTADVIWVRDRGQDRFLTGVLFHSAADSLGQIREWQAVELDRNRIEIRLEMLPTATMAPETVRREYLGRLIESGLPGEVAVGVRIMSSLPPDPLTGKFRRIISRRGPAEANDAAEKTGGDRRSGSRRSRGVFDA
jgi:phenylacetate-coenzyme A ligase PaaK-like adenylate-forming protein